MVELPGIEIISIQFNGSRIPIDVADSQLICRNFPYGYIPVFIGGDPSNIQIDRNTARAKAPGESGGSTNIETRPIAPCGPDIAVGAIMKIALFLESPITQRRLNHPGVFPPFLKENSPFGSIDIDDAPR